MCATLLTCALLLTTAPAAHAHTGPSPTRFSWQAIPCAAACASWIGHGFDPCAAPFPPGGYADVVTRPAPEIPAGKQVAVLESTLDPLGRWEHYICDVESGTEIGRGLHVLGEPCDNDLGSQPIGPFDSLMCHLDASGVVLPGRTYILRAYNIASAQPAAGSYWFVFV